MGCCIASLEEITPEKAIERAKDFGGLKGMDLAKEVTTQDDYGWIEGTWPEYSETDINLNIVAYDFGIKKNILRLLTESVGKVDVVNAKTSFEDVMKKSPNGIFFYQMVLRDPEPCEYAIENIKLFLKAGIPIFGICLGHQLLSIAAGAKNIQNEIWPSWSQSPCSGY